MPPWIRRWKESSCRAGAIRTLSLVCAYNPDIDLATIIGGKPEFHADGSRYTSKDFHEVEKTTRRYACEIADALNIREWTHMYNMNNHWVTQLEPEERSLDWRKLAGASSTQGIEAAPSSSTPAMPPPTRAQGDADVAAQASAEASNEATAKQLEDIEEPVKATTPEPENTAAEDPAKEPAQE